MPTILYINGWRLFFYMNEGNEPPHVHCSKADCDAKYWLNFRGTDMNKVHQVQDVKFNDERLVLTVDGQTVSRSLPEISPRLAKASDSMRKHYVVAPSGYGIHWPDCDEDLSIDALLGIRHNAPMMAAEDSVEYLTTNKPLTTNR
jgi:hypothetical protein